MSTPTDTMIQPARTATTDAIRLAVVTTLLNGYKTHTDGYTTTQVAARTGIHRTDVEAIAGLAGWPNVKLLTNARDRLVAALAPAPKTVCIHDGCNRDPYGKGLCDPHYRQARRAAAK